MSNLLGNLINLFSTQNAAAAGTGNQSKSSPDGLPFEKVLQQVESQNQDSGLSQAGTHAQEFGGEAALSGASAAPTAKDTLLAVQTPQKTIHLSVQAASLEAGMKQVTQLLQGLSSLSDEQGAALVSSLTGGAVSKADALGFVQNLKSILKGLNTQDVSALQTGSLQAQWLDRLQQDTQAASTIAQAMVAMSQTIAVLPNQALNTGAGQTVATTSENSNSSRTGLQIAGFTVGQTDVGLLGAGKGITTAVQMPSDWKVATSASPAITSDGSTENLQALVDLLTQSNAGQVLLSQAVAYEFTIKVSSQNNAGTVPINANAPIVPQQNAVVDAATASSAIQELQSQTSQTQLLPNAATSILGSAVDTGIASSIIQDDQTATPVVESNLNSAGKGSLQQTVVLRLDNTVANSQTNTSTEPAGFDLSSNLMPVATTVSSDSNATPEVASGLSQADKPGLSVSTSVTNPSAAVSNADSLPVVDLYSNKSFADRSVLSADASQKTVAPVVSQKISVIEKSFSTASVSNSPISEELPQTTSSPSSVVLSEIPVVDSSVSKNNENAFVTQKSNAAVEVPQIASASNQEMIPNVLDPEKGITKTDTPSSLAATQAVSTVSVAIPEAVPKTAVVVENTSAKNNLFSTGTLNLTNQPATSSSASQTGNGLAVASKVDQSSDLTTAFKDNTDTQSTTWTVVTTASADALSTTAGDKKVSSAIQPDGLIQQIANQVSVEAVQTHSVSHLSFQLVPENLGKITIQVSLVDQLVTAKILVTHADVREALQNNLVELKTSLYQAGLQIDQLQVQVQGGGAGLLAQYYQFQQEGNGQTSSRAVQDSQVKRETADNQTEVTAVGGSWNAVNLLV